MEFKDIFKELRKERNFSQRGIADAVGVSKATIGMWEIGERYPSREKMEEIADYFNVDLDYLYGKTSIRRKIILDENGNKYVPEYAPDMMELIYLYSQISDKQKESVLSLLRSFID